MVTNSPHFSPENTGTGGILQILYRFHSAHTSVLLPHTHGYIRNPSQSEGYTSLACLDTQSHLPAQESPTYKTNSINAFPDHPKRSRFKNSSCEFLQATSTDWVLHSPVAPAVSTSLSVSPFAHGTFIVVHSHTESVSKYGGKIDTFNATETLPLSHPLFI